MANEIRNVIMLAVATMVVALIIPLAVGLLSDAGSTVINATSGATLADIADPSVVTLLTVLLPVIIIIVIVLLFLPRSGA